MKNRALSLVTIVLLMSSLGLHAQDFDSQLFRAVKSGDTFSVFNLIGYGAKVNARDNTGKTPLHYAAMQNNREIAKILIKGGADMFAEDAIRKRPIDYPIIQDLFEQQRRKAVMGGAQFTQWNRFSSGEGDN